MAGLDLIGVVEIEGVGIGAVQQRGPVRSISAGLADHRGWTAFTIEARDGRLIAGLLSANTAANAELR
jgi:hypothetical protein